MIEVSQASPAHFSVVLSLLDEYYEAVGVMKRDTPDEVRAFLTDKASALWIAYAEQIPAGCVILRPLPSINRAGECKRLYVRPAFRGRGVANALLDALENYALANDSAWIYLDSNDDLRDAIRLYRKRGYQDCDRYNDNPQATVYLRKELVGQELNLRRMKRE